MHDCVLLYCSTMRRKSVLRTSIILYVNPRCLDTSLPTTICVHATTLQLFSESISSTAGSPRQSAHLSYNDLHCFTQCPLRVSSCSRRRIQAHESLPDTPRICASTAYTRTLNDQRLGQRAQKHLRITAYINHELESSGATHSTR